MQKEFWIDIIGYEKLYQISNLGNVKSLSKQVCNNKRCYISKEKILKPILEKSGYYNVFLYKNSKSKNFKVHQLMAVCFLNHKPCGFKIVVDHVNNDKLDNRIENLQLVTNRENNSKGKKNKTSKYTGVSKHKSTGKWVSYIRINGKVKYLGSFENEYDAHLAYQNKLKEILNGK